MYTYNGDDDNIYKEILEKMLREPQICICPYLENNVESFSHNTVY